MNHDATTLAPPLPPAEQERADLFGLIGALLLAPPLPLLQALSVAPEMTGGGSDALAPAWRALVLAARALGPEGVQREHAQLFVAVGEPALDPRASRYLRGVPMHEPLVPLRAALRELGLARQRGAAFPEDHLGALCESMRLLAAGGPGFARRPLAVQHAFFAAHLAPWVDACLRDLRQAEGACFYAALADLAQAFFDLERRAFELEEAMAQETDDVLH
jgi:TorA maturation chaperone TorD